MTLDGRLLSLRASYERLCTRRQRGLPNVRRDRLRYYAWLALSQYVDTTQGTGRKNP